MSSTTTDAGLKKQKRPAMEENAGEKLKPGKGKSGSKTAKAQAQNGTGIGAAATSAANGNKSNRVGPVNGGVQQAPSSNRPFGAQTATKRSTMTLAEALFKNAGIPMPSTLQLLARVRNDANKASPNQIPSPNPVPPIKRNKIQSDTPNSPSPSIDANVGNCNDGNGGMSASQPKQKNKSANVGAVSECEKSLAKKNSVEKGKEKENGEITTKQRELQSKSLPIIAPKSAQKKPEAAKKPSCPVESPAVSMASTANLTALSVPTAAINESILGKSPSRQEARTATPVAIVAPMTANKPVPETVAAVEADKEPEKGQPDVVGLKGAKEMAEMATRTLVLILRPEVSVPTETNTTSWQFYAQWLQRSFQLKAESVIETSKPFLLHGLYYIVYVILDSTKTHDSVLEVYEKNPENYQCFISSGSVMLKEGSEEFRKNKCADAEGQPQQQPLQTDSNSKSDEVALVECLELLLIDKPSADNAIGGAMDKTTSAQVE